MFKKLALGFLAVALLCSVAHSGYTFGKYLADKDSARSGASTVRARAAR